MSLRIIAKLDVKPPFVVKPVHFEGLRKVGTPHDLAYKYYLQGADELCYIDIVARLYQREILLDRVKESSQDCFVPFSVGGGITSIEDCTKLFHSGADKVVINTYALQHNPDLINEAAKIFGSQSVVINIESKQRDGYWECYSDCGRIPSGKNVLEWIKEVESRGAGEIFLQSVDTDGKMKGFDIELISQAVSSVSIPVVACSGAGSVEDILEVAQKAKPSGIAIASLLHYDKTTIGEIKTYLSENGIKVAL
jgi:cyclase